MGFFSWNCSLCGHSIMNPYVISRETSWKNACVAVYPNKNTQKGSYNGYGRVGSHPEIDYGEDVELMHRKCWKEAGKPGYKKNSPDAAGQGHFYDDAEAPPDSV